MPIAVDESAADRLDGRGTGILRAQSRDSLSGREIGRSLPDEDDGRQGDSAVARRCESFHSE